MSLMWMPAATTRPPLRTAWSAAGTSGADRREDDRRVERLRRRLVRAAGPFRAELAREILRRAIAGPGEGIDALPLVAGDLRDDVGGGAEAVEAEPLGRRRPCGGRGGRSARRRAAVRLPHRRSARAGGSKNGASATRESGIAAVDVAAGEMRVVAEILRRRRGRSGNGRRSSRARARRRAHRREAGHARPERDRPRRRSRDRGRRGSGLAAIRRRRREGRSGRRRRRARG